jgi:hypothetical protein
VATWPTTTAVCADAGLLARGTGLGLTCRSGCIGSGGKSLGERTHVVGGDKRGSGARGPQDGWSPLPFIRPMSRDVERRGATPEGRGLAPRACSSVRCSA